MSKLLISKAHEIRTEEYWKSWSEDFWNGRKGLAKLKDKRFKISQPKDHWERTKKVLGLQPYEGE